MRKKILIMFIMFFLFSTAFAADFSEYKLKDYPVEWEPRRDVTYNIETLKNSHYDGLPFGFSFILEKYCCVGGLVEDFNTPYPGGSIKYNVAFFSNADMAHKAFIEIEETLNQPPTIKAGDVGDDGCKFRYEKYIDDKFSGNFYYFFREKDRIYFIGAPAEAEEYFNRLFPVKKGISPIVRTLPKFPGLPQISGLSKILGGGLAALAGAIALSILGGAIAFICKAIAAASASKVASVAALPKVKIKTAPLPPAERPAGPKISIKKPIAPAKTGPKINIVRQEKPTEVKEKKKVIARIEIKAEPVEIVADGKSKSKLTFKVFDIQNKPVAGEMLRFQLSRDSYKLPPTAITDINGEIHLEYVASTEERTIAIIAHSTSNPEVTQAIQIKEKRAGLSEIVLKSIPEEVVADGKSKSQVKIYAFDNTKKPVSGERIELWFEMYDGSKIEPAVVVTDINGEADAIFTSGKIKGEQKVSARAGSDWKIKADVKIKLKEEIYYEARDRWTGFKVRVNIPNKGLNTIKEDVVLGARMLDNFDNQISSGYSAGLLELAALIGYYGLRSDAVYKNKAEIWKKVYVECSRVATELEVSLSVGLGVGIMSFTSSVANTIAGAFGGKLISAAATIIGAADKKLGDKVGIEMQDKIYSLIQKEKEYYEEMSSIAGELASAWGDIAHTGGSPDAALKIMSFDKEIEFYNLNNKVLTVAEQKGKLTESFSESDYAAIKADMENIDKAIFDAKSEKNEIKRLRAKINNFIKQV